MYGMLQKTLYWPSSFVLRMSTLNRWITKSVCSFVYRRRYKMKLGISIIILLICGSASLSQGQSCNPAVVSYLVHDESGKLLSESELKAVHEQLPKSIGDADTFLGEISLADDGKSFYRPESVNFDKGKKMAALEFINAKTCTMHLSEVTLVYH